MGIFAAPKQRQTYVPPLDSEGEDRPAPLGTILGGDAPASNDWLGRLAPANAGFLPKDAGSDSAPVAAPDRGLVRVADPVDGRQPPAVDPGPTSSSAAQSSAGKRGIAPPTELSPGTPLKDGPGQPVILPDGSSVPDRYSPTGKLMSPVGDLSEVAAEGRRTADTYRALRGDPLTFEAGTMQYIARFGFALGHGGKFDYQRGPGNSISGFEQRPQFRNVSNVNVGLFGQQAGLSLDDVLKQAGEFAN